MKFFHKFSKYIILPVFALAVGGCFTDFEGVNVDPNNPADASVDLLVPQIQYSLSNTMAGGANSATHGFCGLISSFDNFGVSNTSFGVFWDNMYAGPLKDIEGLINKAQADNLPHHLAIGQLLKAYAFSSMVNLFGDVPYSEAFKGEDIASRAPTFDADETIFNDCIGLIDQAIANLNLTSGAKVSTDLIYGGDINKWKAFANSLKLKLVIESWRADPAKAKAEINTLLGSTLITSAVGDFDFKFSKTINPDNRHPWYVGPYTGDEFTYISHQLMVEMLEDGDPRWPFYFKRQNKRVLDVNDPTDAGTIPCWTTPGCNYGYVVLNTDIMEDIFGPDITQDEIDFAAGIFGRDRADASGVPNDGVLRTIPGVYPCGGFHDSGAPATPTANAAPGGGIFPILSHVNVLYYQIEAILEDQLAVSGDARALFEQAIRSHITKVVNFGLATGGGSIAPDAATTDAYVALWLERYDAAPTNRAKLNVVMKQLWFSSWGNGFEIYNAMRRTHDPNASNSYGYNGLPNTLQDPVSPTPRKWPHRFPYPSTELTLNPSAAPWKDVIWDDASSRLFWDTE